MGDNVFLVRSEPSIVDRTVLSAVDPDEHDDAPAGLADADADADGVRLWGVTEGSGAERHAAKLERGDLLLFFSDDEYVATARLGERTESASWVSETYWDGTDVARAYELTDVNAVSVPAAAVHRIFDYAAGYSPGALMRVADGRVRHDLATIDRAIQRYSEKHAAE